MFKSKMGFKFPKKIFSVGLNAGRFAFNGIVTRFKSGKLRVGFARGTKFEPIVKG